MKAVTTNSFLFIVLVRQSVKKGIGGQRMVKGGVKNGHVGYAREQPSHFADTRHVDRVVQRGQRVQRFDLGQGVVGDNGCFGKAFSAVDDAVRHDADFAQAADDAGAFGSQFVHDGCEGFGETAVRQITFDRFARAVVDQTSARDSDAFDQAPGLARFIGGIVKLVFYGRGAAVDDEDPFGPFAFKLEAVRVIALAQSGGGLSGVEHDIAETFRDDLRDLLHGGRFFHYYGLEERNRNQQQFSGRVGDKVGEESVAGHEREFAESVACLKLAKDLASATIANNGSREGPTQNYAEVCGFVAAVSDGFVGLEGDDARAINQMLQVVVREWFEEGNVRFEEIGNVHRKALMIRETCFGTMNVVGRSKAGEGPAVQTLAQGSAGAFWYCHFRILVS